MEKFLTSLFGVEEETPKPPVSIVDGKWSLYGIPVMGLPAHEREVVFSTIIDALNVDQDRTNSLKF